MDIMKKKKIVDNNDRFYKINNHTLMFIKYKFVIKYWYKTIPLKKHYIKDELRSFVVFIP